MTFSFFPLGHDIIIFRRHSFLASLFLTSLVPISLFTATPAHASSFIRLNYEALKWRNIASNLIDTMEAVKETLMLTNTFLPIRARFLDGKDNFNSDKFYKDMLAKRSSTEVFQLVVDFLTQDENSAIRAPLQSIFINERRGDFFIHGGTKFYIRWLWLFPTDNGLVCVPQDNLTDEIAEKIWNSGTLFPIIEAHYSLPDDKSRISAFFQRGIDKVQTKFPSAYLSETDDGLLEIVHLIFPDVTGIPAIVRKTIEMKQ